MGQTQILVKIKNQEDRRKVAGILADNGHTVECDDTHLVLLEIQDEVTIIK